MSVTANEKKWQRKVSNDLKKRLLDIGWSYNVLSEKLKNIGVNETPSAIGSKISRGTFRATFYLQIIEAIEREEGRASHV